MKTLYQTLTRSLILCNVLLLFGCKPKVDYSYRSGSNVRWLNPKEQKHKKLEIDWFKYQNK